MSQDRFTGDEPLARAHRRRRLFPLSARVLRDERGLVRMSLAGSMAVVVGLMLFLGLNGMPGVPVDPASADHFTLGLGFQEIPGNPHCTTGGNHQNVPGLGYEFGSEHTTSTINVAGFGTITVTLGAGSSFTWSSDFPIDAVIAKGGPNANVQVYQLPDGTGTPVFAGSLQAPGTAGLSHIEFCFSSAPPADPNIDVIKSSTPETQVAPGGAVAWNVTISVTDGPATGTVTDDVPDGFVIGSVVETEGTISCSTNGQEVTCTLTNTPTGSYSVTINTTAPGDSPDNCRTYTNSVEVTGTDANGGTNSDTDDVEVTPCTPPPDPNIDVAKSSTPETTVAPGGSVAWNVTLSVTDGPATGTVTDTVPAGFTIGTVTEPDATDDPGDTISCSTNSQEVTCALAGTPTGTYQVVINTTAPGDSPDNCRTYTNSVEVTGTDANGGTNSDTDDVEVTPCTPPPDPNIDVSKNSTPETQVVPGGAVAWNVTISVTDGPASGTVTDDVPDGFVIGSVVETEGTISCSTNGQEVTCTLTNTPTGSYSVTINTTAPGDNLDNCRLYTNSVEVTGTDANGGMNRDTDDVEVTPCTPAPDPNIDVAKSSTPETTVAPGGSVAWNVTISVTDGPATGTVTDDVPAGFTIGTVTEPDATDDPGDTISCSTNLQEVTCQLTGTPTGTYLMVINTTAPDGSSRADCTTHTNSVQVTGNHIGPDGNSDTDDVEVRCAAPIETTASPGGIVVGESVTDTADLPDDATGSVEFFLCGPEDAAAECLEANATSHGSKTLDGDGDATSDPITLNAPGVYCFLVKYTPDQSSPYLEGSHTNDTSECVTVRQAQPDITTVPSPVLTTVGDELNDTANLTGGVSPTGTITFALFPPSDDDCSGTPVYTSVVNITDNGIVSTEDGTESGDNIADSVGTWRWTAVYSGDDNNAGANSGCQEELVTVEQEGPDISTTPTPETATIGDEISDTANLSGGFSPTGTITFALFAPSDEDCSGDPVYTSVVTVTGNGNYDSDDGVETGTNVTNAVGTWRWTAVYSGDTNNAGATSGCQEELVTIVEEPTGIITVFKVCVPEGVNATFTVDLFQDGGDTPIQTKMVDCDAGQVQFDGLTGNHTYVVQERDHPDWMEDDSDCAEGLALNPREDIRSDSCTITNTFIPVDPTIETEVSVKLINLGGSPSSVTDYAVVSDGDPNNDPIEGEVDFTYCFSATAFDQCETGGTLLSTETLAEGPSGEAEATSDEFTPTEPGFYCFRVDFRPANSALFNEASHTDETLLLECFEVTQPDIDVEKSDDPDPVLVGGELTYTIVVTNNGTGPTSGTITVVDGLPDGLTTVSVTENGWDCDDEAIVVPTSGAVLTCTYDEVVEEGQDAPNIVITVTVPGDSCDNLNNVVTVSGPDAQDDTADNTDDEATDVDGCDADLDISKEGSEIAVIGDEIEYLIEVFNDGNHLAEDVVVTDNLDDGLDGVSAFWDDDNDPAAGGTACDVNAGNVVVCEMGDVPAGESRWVLVTATIDDCDDIVNQATVEWTDPGDEPGAEDDTEESNDSNVVTTEVVCGSIVIVKDTDPETDGIDFEFTSDFGGFELEDGQLVLFDELEPGVYTVTESDLPANWDLTFIDCINDDAGLAVDVDVDLGDGTVEINLRPGENVTCLFNNVFTPPPPPPPPVTTDEEEPAGSIAPPLVDEVEGVQVTATTQPQPSPTLISEIQEVRRLPATGSGGPSGDGNVTPWVLLGAAGTLIALAAMVVQGRRRNESR